MWTLIGNLITSPYKKGGKSVLFFFNMFHSRLVMSFAHMELKTAIPAGRKNYS